MKLIAPYFWQKRNFISILLLPFSFIYYLLHLLRRKKPIYLPKAKIITVGNITVGGAGKTPVVIFLAKLFSNKKVAILTRGYGGIKTGPVLVSDEDNAISVGDEALIHYKTAPTCVAKNRLEGIKFLESLGFEIIITDDGLQDNRFKKDLTIAVVDALKGFGNEFIFPAGPLREPIQTGLNKADCIILIGKENIILKTSIPIIKGKFVPRNTITNKKLIAFAGIGNPEKFFSMLKNKKNEVLRTHSFGDHHNYSNKEIELLLKEARNCKAQLITTEKDYVKIDEKHHHKIINYLIDLELENKEILDKFLLGLDSR